MYQMKKNIRTLKLIIPVGEKENNGKIFIPTGDNVFVGAVVKPAQDQLVDIEILENGTTIQDPIDANWFDGAVGRFEDRTLMLPYKGGSELEAVVKTPNNIAGNDLYIELVFLISNQGDANLPGGSC